MGKALTKKESDRKKARFITTFKANACNISQACKALKIQRQTFYNWIRKDMEFANAVMDAREELVDFAESTLLTMIKEGNPTATIYFLKTQGKHRGYAE